MNATNYLEVKLAEHVAGIAPYTMPSTLFIHLHTADPTEIGTVSECTDPQYVRQAITFTGLGGGQVANSNLIRFDDCGAVTLTHCSISDGTNRLLYGALDAPAVMADGQPYEIPIGNFVFAVL
jgi:hypothetical protein